MKPFLRSQLERYAQRLQELDFLLSREDIMADMAQYRTISREHAEVTQIAGRYARYQQREADLAAAQELLADPDMAEMAQEEIERARKTSWWHSKTSCSACCCPKTRTTRARLC
jgi:peptide chain release factor 1